jgi:ATP-dependent DNA ligase
MTALPQWVRPQLTQLVDAAPEGDQWLHEIKFGGYRMHARLDRGSVKLLTRTGLDSTHKYAGRVGSGINIAEFQRLWRRLQPLATDTMPLAAAQHPLRLATCVEPRALGPPRARRGGRNCGAAVNST